MTAVEPSPLPEMEREKGFVPVAAD